MYQPSTFLIKYSKLGNPWFGFAFWVAPLALPPVAVFLHPLYSKRGIAWGSSWYALPLALIGADPLLVLAVLAVLAALAALAALPVCSEWLDGQVLFWVFDAAVSHDATIQVVSCMFLDIEGSDRLSISGWVVDPVPWELEDVDLQRVPQLLLAYFHHHLAKGLEPSSSALADGTCVYSIYA